MNQLPEENTVAYLIGVMLTANHSLLEDPEKSKIKELLKMAQPFQDLYQEFKQEGRQEGLQEGKKTKALEVAKRLLSMGIDAERVQQATGLSEEEVRKLSPVS